MTQLDTRHLRTARQPGTTEPQSPVDQVLASSQGPALLDSRPAGQPVPKAMWLLPALLGVPGGVVGWLIVRRSNLIAGRLMLILGVVFTVMSLVTTKMLTALVSASAGALGG